MLQKRSLANVTCQRSDLESRGAQDFARRTSWVEREIRERQHLPGLFKVTPVVRLDSTRETLGMGEWSHCCAYQESRATQG